MSRMTDERLAEIEVETRSFGWDESCENLTVDEELLVALKAERQWVVELEKRLKIDEPHPFPKHYDALDLLNHRYDAQVQRAEAAEARIEAVRGLVDKWQERIDGAHPFAHDYMEGVCECANELMEALGD